MLEESLKEENIRIINGRKRNAMVAINITCENEKAFRAARFAWRDASPLDCPGLKVVITLRTTLLKLKFTALPPCRSALLCR